MFKLSEKSENCCWTSAEIVGHTFSNRDVSIFIYAATPWIQPMLFEELCRREECFVPEEGEPGVSTLLTMRDAKGMKNKSGQKESDWIVCTERLNTQAKQSHSDCAAAHL